MVEIKQRRYQFFKAVNSNKRMLKEVLVTFFDMRRSPILENA